jgi:GAF domain-containing protein
MVIVESQAPLLLGTSEESAQPGALRLPRSGEEVDSNESYLGVPILAGGKAIGVIAVQSYKQNAYGQDHLRLLQTMAAAMSTALENARLFDETQRLLKETEQRAAELAIINTVQAGLASKLDMQSIYQLVGDKVREIFKADTTYVDEYDPETQIITTLYYFEMGQSIALEPFLIGPGISSHIIRTRRPVHTGSPAETMELGPILIPSPEEKQDLNQSVLAVPILIGDEATAVISVQSHREHAFSTSDLRLLETLASAMSVALENARLFDETQRLLKETEQRAAELAIMNSVQEGLARQLDLQAIIDLIGEKVGEIFNADTTQVLMYDVESNWAHHMYYTDRGERISFPDGPGKRPSLGAVVVDSAKPLLLGTKEDGKKLGSISIPRNSDDVDRNESYLGVPILASDKVIGLIAVQSYRQNAFNHADLTLLQTLANSMSVALENARLFDETQRLLKETEQRNAELAIINSVQEGLAKQLDLQRIIDLIGEKVGEIFAADTTTEYLYETDGDWAHHVYYADRGERIDFPDGPINRPSLGAVIVDTRKPLSFGTLEESGKFGAMRVVRSGEAADKNESYLGVPILTGDRVIGVIAVQSYKKNTYGQDDVRLLQTLASSMSVALENARLFDETQRLLKETEQRAAELAIINSVQEGLASKLDMQAIYDLVGDKVRDIFDAQAVLICRLDVEQGLEFFQYNHEKGRRFHPAPRRIDRVRQQLIETRQPYVNNRISLEVIRENDGGVVEGTAMPKSVVFAPMLVGAEVKGYVSIQNIDRFDAFTESDVRLLQTLANSMSVALESARLFDETQRLLKEMTWWATRSATSSMPRQWGSSVLMCRTGWNTTSTAGRRAAGSTPRPGNSTGSAAG